MIWRPILSRARPTLMLMLIPIAVTVSAPAARSQDHAMQERLDRLEKDLTMLQRQIYRGGAGPVIAGGSGVAVDAELRMDRLETQMRELTGRVEDAVNGTEQLRRRLEQINSDLDVRLSQGQGPPRTPASNSHAAAGIADTSPTGPIALRGLAAGTNTPPSRPGSLTPPGTLVPPPRDFATGSGGLSPPGTSEPETESAYVAGARPPTGGALPAGSASEQYNIAFGLLKQSDPAAEEALKTFVAQHRTDPLAGSAQYWLGETYYMRGRYSEAASAFAEGYKRYPKGTKAPDELLKLGMSLARANQRQNACVALAQLDRDFPNARSAIKDQATAEKKRLGC